jgi:hypothetical protein
MRKMPTETIVMYPK